MKMMKCSCIIILILLTTATAVVKNENKSMDFYDSSDLSSMARLSSRGLVKFEGHYDTESAQNDQQENRHVTFEEESSAKPLKFDDTDGGGNIYLHNVIINKHNSPNMITSNQGDQTGHSQISFQDDNRIRNQNFQHKRKRRRRRRPKQQSTKYPAQGNYGFQNLASPGGIPGNNPEYSGSPVDQNYGYADFPVAQRPAYPGLPGAVGQLHTPPRRPRLSVASEALSAVTRALTSIALYDDYQCVPRLLCEAAAGGALGSAGSSGLLQSITGLQPLLVLLSTYNGISTSPLFVFGRAVFFGMVSKANPGTCRYAYSLCPTDPEQLVHYLNNHNGGFFRFFSAPEFINTQNHNNLEQFYNQLTVPGQYGLLSSNLESVTQNYGLHGPHTGDFGNILAPGTLSGTPSYGLHSNLANQQSYNYNLPTLNQSNGYGSPYYQNPYSKKKFQTYKAEVTSIHNNKIQKRIQNLKHDGLTNHSLSKPLKKWQFPEYLGIMYNEDRDGKLRNDKLFKFPSDEIMDSQFANQAFINKKGNGVSFPGIQSNREYLQNEGYPFISVNSNKFYLDHRDRLKVDAVSDVHSHSGNEEDIETLYIIRGNGDPNSPEIVKIKKGQY